MLEIYLDFNCPWCYLSTFRFEKLCTQFDLKPRWVYFPLNEDCPPAGEAIAELYEIGEAEVAEMMAGLKKHLDQEGLPFDPSLRHLYGSQKAHQLAHWFASLGKPPRDLHRALYKALFVRKQSIGDVQVLAHAAQEAGASAQEAYALLESERFLEAVQADYAYARQNRVIVAPTLILGEKRLVGAQPQEKLEAFIQGSIDELAQGPGCKR